MNPQERSGTARLEPKSDGRRFDPAPGPPLAAELLQRGQRLGMRSRRLDANPELVHAYRLPRMLKVALTVALGALKRTESRGAHFRDLLANRKWRRVVVDAKGKQRHA